TLTKTYGFSRKRFSGRSAEQAFADEPARLGAAGDGEDGAADVLDVLVQRVVLAELALQGDELLFRVLLEADKEEAGFELAEALVDAVGERVAAAEDPDAVVFRRRGEPHVGVFGDHRFAVVALHLERQ